MGEEAGHIIPRRERGPHRHFLREVAYVLIIAAVWVMVTKPGI